MYDGLTLGSVNDDVLILTVKPGWMLDNLKALNRVVDRENDLLFVTDGAGRLLMSNDRQLPEGLDTKDVLRRIAASEQSLDSFIYAQDGSKYKVTYLSKALNNWQIISLQDYDDVLGSVRQMRWTEIAVTLSVALLAVLLSVFFALRLYKPVGHLLALVPPPGGRPSTNSRMSCRSSRIT